MADVDSTLQGEYAPDRVIVTYSDGGTSAQNFQVRERTRTDVEAVSSKEISPRASRTAVLTLGKNVSVSEAIKRLRNQPGVVYVQPDYKVYALDIPPTDSYFASNSLWGMYGSGTTPANSFGSNAISAWGRGYTGSSSIAVGVVDEGIQISHPDLAANIWVNPGEIAGNRLDDDNNGYIDDINGWDFVNNDNTVFDGRANSTLDAHGTHVSGTIGGRANNGTGVVGVNWNVKIISAKFLGLNGGYTSDAVRALDYLTALKIKGAPIVASNNSWGGGGFDQALLDAIDRGGDAGILFIAAAGNNGQNTDTTANYPSNYVCDGTANNRGWDCIISVASINSTGARSSFSNYGATTVDLGAPGEGIISSVPLNSWANYSGTSMATPHVTGAVALCASMGLTNPRDIKSAILSTVTPRSSLAGITTTGGILNLDGMTTACSGKSAQALLTITNTTLNATPGTSIKLTSNGGSGSGALTYLTPTTGCAITNGDSLTSTNAANCLVYATKAASGSLTAATSPAVTFAFAFTPQATLRIANTVLSNPANVAVRLTTSGGSGLGAVSYAATGTNCLISNGDSLSVTAATTCRVTATKASASGFAAATSASVSFVFTAVAQTPLAISNTTLSVPRSSTIQITVSGGTGAGTLSYRVTGTNCSVSTAGLLKPTRITSAATCIVSATKAANGIYTASTSPAVTFSFT